jgi:hypothetical protein
MVFSSKGSFTCNTYCDTGPPFLRLYSKDQWFYLLNAVLLAKEQSLPILNVLGLTRPARAGLELSTYRLLSESTTTKLRQLVPLFGDEFIICYIQMYIECLSVVNTLSLSYICSFYPIVNITDYYTPVFRQDVLWYNDVCMSVHPSFRPSVRGFLLTISVFFYISSWNLFLVYFWVSLKRGEILYDSDLYCLSFPPLFHIGYVIYPANSSHSFWVRRLLFCWILVWILKMCMCQELWLSLISKITGFWTQSFLRNKSTYSI